MTQGKSEVVNSDQGAGQIKPIASGIGRDFCGCACVQMGVGLRVSHSKLENVRVGNLKMWPLGRRSAMEPIGNRNGIRRVLAGRGLAALVLGAALAAQVLWAQGAAPGTQALIQWLARLIPCRSVSILGFSGTPSSCVGTCRLCGRCSQRRWHCRLR